MHFYLAKALLNNDYKKKRLQECQHFVVKGVATNDEVDGRRKILSNNLLKEI